jgi:hypothetical protein
MGISKWVRGCIPCPQQAKEDQFGQAAVKFFQDHTWPTRCFRGPYWTQQILTPKRRIFANTHRCQILHQVCTFLTFPCISWVDSHISH